MKKETTAGKKISRAAQQLGRMARGHKKTLTPAFLAANREKLGKINAARARKKRQQQNDQAPL